MVIGPAGQLAVLCKSTELKRCSMIQMRWNIIIIIIIIILLLIVGLCFVYSAVAVQNVKTVGLVVCCM